MDHTMMKKTILAVTLASMLAGCSTIGNAVRDFDDPVAVKPQLKNETALRAPAAGAITVAVYSFRDQTGQRKASQNIAQLSSAVTQGADAYLVRSLQTVGDGRWFKVVERGGLDNLVKERQLIRQMRELYQGKDAQPLPPMIFAGMILEGGIIGYDSNTLSGGSGARLLGIGASTEYRQDEVTISLRAVSVATGEVLVSVTMSKTVISFQDKMGLLKFYDAGTQSLELETGAATNESMNKAVQLAIHAAVIEMIREGERKGHWSYRSDVSAVIKPEENKNVMVQQNAAPRISDAPAPKKAQEPTVTDRKTLGTEKTSAAPAAAVKIETQNKVQATASSPAAVTAPVKKARVRDWVNLRIDPSMDARQLEKLSPNTELVVLGEKGPWMQVKHGENTGWIARTMLEVK